MKSKIGIEYERKFLPYTDDWKKYITFSYHIEQFYLAINEYNNIRVRIIEDEDAFVTVKGNGNLDAREEHEFPVALSDAIAMRSLSPYCPIYKIRNICDYSEDKIEIDVFEKDNAGLIVAEIEFNSREEMDAFRPFEWLGKEITNEVEYYNVSLAQEPFSLRK